MSYAGTYNPNDPSDPHAVRMNPSLRDLVKKSKLDAAKIRAERAEATIAAALIHYEHERADATDRQHPFGQEMMANAARAMARILRGDTA